MSVAETVERYRRTAEISWFHPPLNPMIYVPETHVMVSRFIDGREATLEERAAVSRTIERFRFDGFRCWDLEARHFIVGPDGLRIIDWGIF